MPSPWPIARRRRPCSTAAGRAVRRRAGNLAAYFERLKARPSFARVHGGGKALFQHGAEGELNGCSRIKPTSIRDLFAAYMANDRKAVENAFTEDFRFTSPYDDEIDKATYFERCWQVSDWIERQNSKGFSSKATRPS